MGFESMPRSKPKVESEEKEEVAGGAKKWLEFVDENGIKVEIGVFEGESDEDAIARAREIDGRLANGG